MGEITANGDTIMRQAHYTAEVYLQHAMTDIDAVFGDGYARGHPELVAAYMQTAALDAGATILAQQIRYGFSDLGEAVASADFHDDT